MTAMEGYLVMFKFWDYIYFKTKSDEVGATLGSMQILEDGGPADAAMWGEWTAALDRVLKEVK